MCVRGICVWFTLMLGAASVFAADVSETKAFFESGAIPTLKLVIRETQQQELRDDPRDYTRCSLIEDEQTTLKTIGVKLKGAAGSYRDFDDRPGLTLSFDKYKKGQRWHGMEKVHLNNLVQDDSYLSEWLGTRIFQAAGYPAPCTGHVHLWINDRDMGIYVLREGFDSRFLKRELGDNDGNLYDRGEASDIDSELEMDSGDDPDDRSDLIGLAAACYQREPQVRWEQLAARADVDQFLSFMALERLCGHWDGYTVGTNNYRLYFPKKKPAAVFLPHGMDQLFGDPGAGLYDPSPSLLGAAILQNDRWREQYRQRLKDLSTKLQPADKWLVQIDDRRDRLQPILEAMNPDQAAAHRERVQELKDRVAQRFESLENLINDGMPTPVEFDESGLLLLTDWYAVPEGEEVELEEVDHGGLTCYRITREPFGDFAGSWRRSLLLRAGNYRLEARVKTDSVIPIPDDQGRGAGLRMVGTGRSEGRSGTGDWETLSMEFEVREDQRDVELILELRARHGTAWYDRASLQLKKLK
jgi:spore coat protein H